MSYTGLLGLPCRLCLCLSTSRHEGYQCVPEGLLHGVPGRTIEGQAVNNCLDNGTPAYQFPDSVRDIGIVTSQSIHPTNHENVS